MTTPSAPHNQPPAPLSDPAREPIDSLDPYPANPRRGSIDAIKESLQSNGLYRPIVVNSRNRQILAGNHTWRAARELGWSTIAVSFVDVDDEAAARIVLADNRTNDLAGYDEAALVDLLVELPELTGTGFDRDDLDRLLAEIDPESPPEPELASPPQEPKTKPGELIELGPHRLLCGDARDPDSYRQLLDGEHPQVLWTDPPYGVSYVGKTEEKLRIHNDGAEGLKELLADSFTAIDGALRPGAPIYIAHPAGAQSLAFTEAFLAQGWSLRQTLIWLKDSIVLGHSDYHYRHEQILYGYKPGQGRLGRGGAGWFGDDAQASVIEAPKPRASREHPTMKPASLIEACLRNSSRAGALVLDPFAGSGSTLVACAGSERAARLIELDPGYCDVIKGRWAALSHKPGSRG